MVNLGTIILSPANELEEVVVTAHKPIVAREIDRIAYDVTADPDAATDPLTEILRKVPLVTVEPDGTIKVKGGTGFKIYKNGRPNQAFSTNAKEIFRSLPANTIERIEVITDPGAREDSEGSTLVLNIVTKRSTTFRGVTGSVGTGMETRNDMIPEANAYITTQLDKVTLTATGSFKYSGNKAESPRETSGYKIYDSTGDISREETSSHDNRRNSYGNLEASWEPDSMNLLSVEAGIWHGAMHQRLHEKTELFSPAHELIYSYESHTYERPEHYTGVWGAANYQRLTRRKGETITLSYRMNHSRQKTESRTDYEDVFGSPMDYTSTLSRSDLSYSAHTLQLDWKRPLSHPLTMNIGAKATFRRQASDVFNEYIPINSTHTEFHHNYTIAGTYFDFVYNQEKINARLGLRYEYSHLSANYGQDAKPGFARDLNDFTPNAAIMWQVSDQYSMKLGYSTSISRPSISMLNPAVTLTPSTVQYGNPNLKSAFNQSFTLTGSWFLSNFMLEAAADFSLCNNNPIEHYWTKDNVEYSSYAGNGRLRTAYLGLWASWNMTDKTELGLNASGIYNYNRLQTNSFHGWMGIFSPQLSQTLPWGLRLSFWASVSTPTFHSLYTTVSTKRDFSWLDYGVNLKRSFLKDNRLYVGLSVVNPFLRNTTSVATYHNAGYTGEAVSTNRYGTYGVLRITYRFGNLKARVRKTDASIENTDTAPLAGS